MAGMSERTFRIFMGAALLLGLYFDLSLLLYTLIGILAFQGITNWRVTRIISRLRYGSAIALGPCCRPEPDAPPARFNFEAERALCLIVAALLLPTYGLYFEQLWLIPWFIGFALFGAGLSGICPMVIGLRSLFGLR
jgi:hypothetical protein